MLKGSWRMARIGGVDINVHWSFSFIILWVLGQSAWEQRDLPGTVWVMAGVLLVFGCVILHEIGHAVMAMSLNIGVKNIVLLPIGGLAQIQSTPDKPLYELFIAATGPLVNLVIALLLVPALAFFGGSLWFNTIFSSPLFVLETLHLVVFQQGSLLGLTVLLIVTNLILFVFNLLPAFPMDGGRILRAGLALILPYPRATQLAIGLGYGLAVLFLVLGVQLANVGLLLMAVFVLVTAHPAWAR